MPSRLRSASRRQLRFRSSRPRSRHCARPCGMQQRLSAGALAPMPAPVPTSSCSPAGPAGRACRVDAVYRRTDTSLLRDEHGALTAAAELLLVPWLAGRLAVVNGFGTGVADDKLVHAYIEEMIRFYLCEEPLMRSVETIDLNDPVASSKC